MPYFVSRQCYWGVEDPYVVEVASGGLDYANPDMLGVKYKRLGEGKEYLDPREAVQAAIAISRAWTETDGAPLPVAYGATGGMTMPLRTPESPPLALSPGETGLRYNFHAGQSRAWASTKRFPLVLAGTQ